MPPQCQHADVLTKSRQVTSDQPCTNEVIIQIHTRLITWTSDRITCSSWAHAATKVAHQLHCLLSTNYMLTVPHKLWRGDWWGGWYHVGTRALRFLKSLPLVYPWLCTVALVLTLLLAQAYHASPSTLHTTELANMHTVINNGHRCTLGRWLPLFQCHFFHSFLGSPCSFCCSAKEA